MVCYCAKCQSLEDRRVGLMCLMDVLATIVVAPLALAIALLRDISGLVGRPKCRICGVRQEPRRRWDDFLDPEEARFLMAWKGPIQNQGRRLADLKGVGTLT